MTDRQVYETLSATGVPCARMWWGPASATPKRPYATYTPVAGDFHAGSENAARMPNYEATLYMAEYDKATVKSFEAAVKSMGTYSRTEGCDMGTKSFVVTFRFAAFRGEQS